MSIRTRLFSLPMPAFVRRACIRRLSRLTASAFGAPPAAAASLEEYAALTVRLARSQGARADVPQRLFESARGLGSRLRTRLGIRNRTDAMQAARALYRMIEVDFKPDGQQTFTVPRCYFARHYSPEVCRLISSLDAGLLSGLTAGGEMTFTQRITEGAAFCRGVVG